MNNDSVPNPTPVVRTTGAQVQGHVVLPFGKEEFRDFIQSLLGAPQSISRRISGTFEMNTSDLIGFHHLLIQRLEQQNDSQLIQFRTKINYSDESTVTLGSLDELQTYNEVRPVVVRAVHLTWDLLVRFNDRKNPERQSINLSIVRDYDDLPHGMYNIDEIEESPYSHSYMEGQFVIRIDHTARTFGADIEALFTGHVRTIIQVPTRFIRELRKWGALAERILLGSTTVCLAVGVMWAAQKRAQLLKQGLVDLRNSGADQTVQAMYSLERALDGEWTRFLVNAIGVSAITLVFVWYFGSRAWRGILFAKPSVFLMTAKSSEYRDKVMKRYQRSWIWFSIDCFLALLLNVVASYVFVWLSER